jgi:hypothetical protein
VRTVVWNMAPKLRCWKALAELDPDVALLNEATRHASTLWKYVSVAAEWVRSSNASARQQPSDLGALYTFLRDQQRKPASEGRGNIGS